MMLEPYYKSDGIVLYCADSTKIQTGESWVDAVVTDPPYELGFMGKDWDGRGVAYSVELWQRMLKMLKPGGYLLAFGGSRTYHRIACAIEDAGFEIRDQIQWVYGSGFPKSLDVSKAIDKRRATNDLIRPWLRSLGSREDIAKAAGVTPRQVDHWLGENKTPCPQTLTEDRFVLLCQAFDNIPEWADEMFSCVGEKLGTITHGRSGGDDFAKRPGSQATVRTVEEFAPATDAARQWSGWGTALKPAHEPIVVARKPLEGTVAANVLKWGTGALNIDGCRVEYLSEADKASATPQGACTAKVGALAGGTQNEAERTTFERPEQLGRWPANLIHDGSEEVLSFFPDSKGQQGDVRGDEPSGVTKDIYGKFNGRVPSPARNDSGSAARFFFCAKTSKSERGPGNNHPTVKPLALMRYLCRLVTPPGGVILDPFCGSGSTALAARAEGFKFVGIEQNEEYCKIAVSRLQESQREEAVR